MSCGETFSGNLTIEDVTEHFESNVGIFQQVHLDVGFTDDAGADVARYRCAFAVPLAVSNAGRKATDEYFGR